MQNFDNTKFFAGPKYEDLDTTSTKVVLEQQLVNKYRIFTASPESITTIRQVNGNCNLGASVKVCKKVNYRQSELD